MSRALFLGAFLLSGMIVALGAAVTLLVRRGLSVPCPTRRESGLLVFDPPGDGAPVTAERVRQIEDEL